MSLKIIQKFSKKLVVEIVFPKPIIHKILFFYSDTVIKSKKILSNNYISFFENRKEENKKFESLEIENEKLKNLVIFQQNRISQLEKELEFYKK